MLFYNLIKLEIIFKMKLYKIIKEHKGTKLMMPLKILVNNV